jgi:hypothetical protein
MFIPNIVDPAVVESQVRALKVADYYLRQGEDTSRSRTRRAALTSSPARWASSNTSRPATS